MSKRIVLALLCAASLSGCASFIAGETGTTPVGTQSGSRSLGQIVIDKSIERTALINLYKLDARFKQARVNIKSFHSSVLLTGEVPDEHLKQLAEDNLKAMSDVKSVHNYITVGNQVSYSTIMQDAAVTANTRALIAKAPVISDSKVLVHTENGVLYVMGRLNNGEIADLNSVLSQVGDVTKIVTLIDNIDPSSVQPSVQTPVAVDSNNVPPTTATATPYNE
ncbi:BON domain-containing protein [Acinetobacter sp. MB5]|uniref:BON domain-containing protein n=1 Tax=Acinetobacter sp. MB5 TaxID=2069438 RepID=UPI000DCFCACE|nr:BON domain-containing protein [Acinetobacter sp. MB5]